jgi:hypothetical protein
MWSTSPLFGFPYARAGHPIARISSESADPIAPMRA